MLVKSAIFSISATAVLAQQSAWGQCGGTGWTGATVCVSGYYCFAQNANYFQCIPLPAGATTAPATTTTTTTTKTTTTTTTTKIPTTTTTTKSSTIPTTTTTSKTTTTSPTKTTTTTTVSGAPLPARTLTGNPYEGAELFVQPDYKASIAANHPGDTKAAAVGEVPTFWWMDTIAKAKRLPEILNLATAKARTTSKPVLVQLVVYDLPDRDCSALASNGELQGSVGFGRYKTEYIDYIVTTLKQYPHLTFAIIVEPDSLANMVTNMGVPKCATAKGNYIDGTKYAIQKLQLPNAALYLDAGNSAWLGWPTNQALAATLFADLIKSISPAKVRGFATNVSNYIPLRRTVADPNNSNPVYDEEQFITGFAAALKTNGVDAKFIVDTGRSGVDPIPGRIDLGEWCNVNNAGFGLRPAPTPLPIAVLDAAVWVKPGGESDGTSDTTSSRYDGFCGRSSALKPAPEAGAWFSAQFSMLLKNAKPAF